MQRVEASHLPPQEHHAQHGQRIHKCWNAPGPASRYSRAVEYLVLLWIGVIALLAFAPGEVTKVVLAAGWAGLVLITLAALLWRGWKALASAG